jgi:Pathogenicity locus
VSGLREIPGVGKETEADLHALGFDAIEQLVGEDPEALFVRLTAHQGGYTDRCNLYVYRCAVYYAEGGRDHELLKWWNWKDSISPPLELLRSSAE